MFVPAGKGGGGEENRDEERGSIELHMETRYQKQRKRERGKMFKQTGVSDIERTDRQASEFLYTRAIPFLSLVHSSVLDQMN